MLFAALSFWVDRLHRRLRAGVLARPRRVRHLDRLLARRSWLFALLLIWRFHKLTARGYLPAAP